MCDVLGLDPLYIANEGKFVCFVREADAEKVRKAIGLQARINGRVTRSHKKEVHLVTKLGTKRILPMLEADQLRVSVRMFRGGSNQGCGRVA